MTVQLDALPPQSTTPPDELFRTIASLDGALFDSYNRCDQEKFGTFFTDDLEFYHDQHGATLRLQAKADDRWCDRLDSHMRIGDSL